MNELNDYPYYIRSIFRGVEHINAELIRKQKQAEKQAISPIDKQERLRRLEDEYEKMMDEIIYQKSRGRYYQTDSSLFLSAIQVDGDRVVLSPDAEAIMKEESTVYCTTENACKAMEWHEKAVECLNELTKLIKDGLMTDDFNGLFELDGENVIKTNIEYDKFVKP